MSTDMATRSTKRARKGGSVLRTVFSVFISKKDDESEEERLCRFLEDAKQEWLDAQSFFDNVTEPELIDYAIHKVDAAQKRYTYLLNQAKHHKIVVDLSKISM